MTKQNWKAGNMVYPLPAVMVSCGRPGEKPNIITVAWCGTVCTNPAMVSISVRPERYSYDILKETGEFVINLTTGALTRAADFCGVRSGRDTDKFGEMHLTPQASRDVACPGIAESPVNIECRVTQILPLGSHHMFLAEVKNVSVDESLLDERGTLRLERADLTAYSHGTYYHLGESIGTFGYSVKKTGQTNHIAHVEHPGAENRRNHIAHAEHPGAENRRNHIAHAEHPGAENRRKHIARAEHPGADPRTNRRTQTEHFRGAARGGARRNGSGTADESKGTNRV